MKKNILKIGLFALVLGAAFVARPTVASANIANSCYCDHWNSSSGCSEYICCHSSDGWQSYECEGGM